MHVPTLGWVPEKHTIDALAEAAVERYLEKRGLFGGAELPDEDARTLAMAALAEDIDAFHEAVLDKALADMEPEEGV